MQPFQPLKSYYKALTTLVLQSIVQIASRLTTFKSKSVKTSCIVVFDLRNVCISFHSFATNKVRQHETVPLMPRHKKKC
jgi:hypothetical protein